MDYKKWQVNSLKFKVPENLKKNKNDKVNMEEMEEIQDKMKKELKGVKDMYKMIEEQMYLFNNSMNLKLNEEMEILKNNMKNNFNKLKGKIEEKNTLIDSKKGLEKKMKDLANLEKFDKRNVFLVKVIKIINKDMNLKNNMCLKCL